MTRETVVEPGNASVAVIGAGDYIPRAIARKFASEGFVVFVGRRRGDKLAPLVAEVEAAGGRISGRSLDARKEEDLNRFLRDADKTAPIRTDRNRQLVTWSMKWEVGARVRSTAGYRALVSNRRRI